MNVLLTGGMGYIGSHVALSLLQSNHQVTILDNLINSNKEVLDNLKSISSKKLNFIQGDILDTLLVQSTLTEFKINAVIHLAGFKAVGESVDYPHKYYKNNLQGTISLIDAMTASNVKTLVFSSSATVYGIPNFLPITEDHPENPNNPYGRSKFYIEQILKDVANAKNDWKIVSLRYFNPVGSHVSGLIGDNPNGIPNNLMPYINQVAANKRPLLHVYGNDYDTLDGTGVRDYIHVEDLAEAHISALNWLESFSNSSLNNYNTFNLGTGVGYSVLEIITSFEKANSIEIPYKIIARREGDIAASFADPSKANIMLQWQASRTLRDMCCSAWNFQKKIIA